MRIRKAKKFKLKNEIEELKLYINNRQKEYSKKIEEQKKKILLQCYYNIIIKFLARILYNNILMFNNN